MNRPLTRKVAVSLVLLSSGIACADLIGLSPSKGSWDEGMGGDPDAVGGSGPNSGGSSSSGARSGSGGDNDGSGGGNDGSGGDNDGSGGDNDGSGGGNDGSGGDNDGSGGDGSGGGPAIDEPSLITSGPSGFWEEGEVAMQGTSATVTVDPSTTYQTWHGFGGTFNEAGWDALLELTAADRLLAMQLLFSKTDGAAFNWGRIPIGASEYAMDRYTLHDSETGSFSIERDEDLLIPYIQAAQEQSADIKFWGSPWTPPPWMKTNDDYDKGVMTNNPANLVAYADYLTGWVEAYEDLGIPIHHVQPQNEPGWAQDYPSCAWGPFTEGATSNSSTPAFLGTFVEDYLVPALANAGVSTEVWFGALSNYTWADEYWGSLDDKSAVEGIGLQWESIQFVPTIRGSMGDDFIIMQSQHKCGNYPWMQTQALDKESADRNSFWAPEAPNNYNYGVETWDLIKNWIEADVNVYMAWNMVLDTGGFSLDEVRPWPQNSLLVVDRNTNELIPTAAYYVFRHFSQYVDPGAVRVDVSSDEALAFENPDGTIVTILHNPDGADSPTTLDINGTLVEFTVPANGWATVNWQN
jgi:glucosylceramidase